MAIFKSITIGLPVSDADRALTWYRKLLGGAEETSPAPGVWEFLITPDAWLQLFESESTVKSDTTVRFESEDIESSHALVGELTSDVTTIETVPGAVRYFEFRVS